MLGAILALGLFGGPRPQPCPSARFVQCHDTRALAANPGFQQALRLFVGDAHERYLHGDKPLYSQVMELIADPQAPGRGVGEDMRLFAGCRRFACPEKAAVIVGQRGIIAIGIVDYSHGDPGLEVIVRHADASAWAYRNALTDWAQAAVAGQAAHDHASTSLHEVRLRALDSETASAAGQAPRRRLFNWPNMPSLPHL